MMDVIFALFVPPLLDAYAYLVAGSVVWLA